MSNEYTIVIAVRMNMQYAATNYISRYGIRAYIRRSTASQFVLLVKLRNVN